MSPRRPSVCLTLLLALTPLLTLAAPPESKNTYYTGKVTPLADLLRAQQIELDPDAAPTSLALQTDDGKIYPLLKDSGSRMYYKDERLLNRPMRLTGRLIADGHLLQVVDVHSYVKGQLHEVYYWCDICAIRRREKKICDCCGGPMELREEAVGK